MRRLWWYGRHPEGPVATGPYQGRIRVNPPASVCPPAARDEIQANPPADELCRVRRRTNCAESAGGRIVPNPPADELCRAHRRTSDESPLHDLAVGGHLVGDGRL